MIKTPGRLLALAACLWFGGGSLAAQAQTAVPVPGGGSYASDVPPANLNDGYDGPPVGVVLSDYDTLFLDPSLKTKPIPTNQWWTDLITGQKSRQDPATGKTVWFQQPFDPRLWLYPGTVQFQPTGMTLFYPKSWVPRGITTPYLPSGQFDIGPDVVVDGVIPTHLGAGDVLLGDFSGSAYPAGWTATGDLARTAPIPGGNWPGEGPPVTGFIGNACLNTYRGTNGTQGSVNSPTFQVQNHYIDVLVGGGNDPVNTAVKLVVNGAVVKTATGQQSATLNWVKWDVSAYSGQNAQIQIVDSSGGGYGFILCSYVVGTDSSADPATLYTSAFTAPKGIVTNYGDWNVDYRETDNFGNSINATVARGIPFVWARYSGLNPRIHVGAGTTLYDMGGSAISTSSGSFTASALAFTVTDGSGITHAYGVFAPDNTSWQVAGDSIVAQAPAYLVYGFLPDQSALKDFNQYAFARPTGTRMTWFYDRSKGRVVTNWTISTTPLKGTSTLTLQGWLPHHYRTAINSFVFTPYSYLTPRGTMKMVAANTAQIVWPFRGIAPALPAPHLNGVANDYDPARMASYMTAFAAGHPGGSGETYFGARELALSAQNMALAAQLGMPASFTSIETNLRGQMADWYTYTPGESTRFFARYNKWDALAGFGVDFGSQAFNDQHFHYGYFAVTSALLGMHDPAFLTQYGGMARQVVKEYANWDRTDPNFPFLRCFDVWEGHSGAGGFADGQGENQESSSEAMNSWAGMFLLGNMLSDRPMTDAGAMGYAIESSAVNEYWQDWKHTNFPASYGMETAGIVFSSSVDYGDYFFNDPVWFNAIQWVATNHWNNYLVRDKAVASNQLSAMFASRQNWSDHSVGGFALDPNFPNTVEGIAEANGPNLHAASGSGLADAVLGFQLLFDPDAVAVKMDQDFAAGNPAATDTTSAGEIYYLTHTLRGLGDQDLNYYTSLPSSAVYLNARTGQRTYVLYNPGVKAQTAIVYNNGVTVGRIVVPARRLVSTTVLGSGRPAATPYFLVASSVPGRIQAVNFDSGGEGLAYHSATTTAASGQYRPLEAVRTEPCSEGGFDVTGAAAGQWLQYTVQVPKTGTYTATFRVSSQAGGAMFHVQDEKGINLTGPVTIPPTGSAQTFTTLTVPVTLTAGAHALRFTDDTAGLSFEFMAFVGTGSAANVPLSQTISMKAQSNTLFVTAENGGNGPLIANRGGASTWEKFQVVDAGNGAVALKSLANGQYVSAGGAGSVLTPSKTTVGPTETFQWIDLGNGLFSLKAANNLYVSAPNSTASLAATQASNGVAETFQFAAY